MNPSPPSTPSSRTAKKLVETEPPPVAHLRKPEFIGRRKNLALVLFSAAIAGISGVSVPLRQIQRFAVFPDRGNLAYGLSHVGAGLSIGKNGISAYEQGTNHLPSRLVYSNAVSGWTHVALVYASRQPRLYVNGELVRSGSASLFANVHPNASLAGSVQGDFGNFEGQLDEVRIWNAALSQAQIQSNMTQH